MAFESLGTFRMNEFTHVLVVPASSVLQQCAHKFRVVQCLRAGKENQVCHPLPPFDFVPPRCFLRLHFAALVG
ncbi:hypothetical protein AE921_18390 [Xanthomonas arboricola]|nr:hypothetical protein AE921_18390 [Xanthomonas arboricola]KOB08314.1 hypothetical protein AE923_11155 [Xanthomonas arboricola]KOB09721.1 hypothetical protein AE922_06515 [Xanthomonas arboricola]KOB19282.1 hypothetical protein AE925_08780 [Xanthomonas arboricola]KOB23008.1 hypothetical protein AE926_12620 [Xanthomonas arboricola]